MDIFFFKRVNYFFLFQLMIALIGCYSPVSAEENLEKASSNNIDITNLPLTCTHSSNTLIPFYDNKTESSHFNHTKNSSPISQISTNKQYIAITFDDGPHPQLTPLLLDILKQRNIKATFFVLGELVIRYPDIVARALAEGHEIGNHSWSHRVLTKLNSSNLHHEIEDTSSAISEITKQPVTLIRPPYGAFNSALKQRIHENDHMKIILWSVDPFDWKNPGANVIRKRIVSATRPGDIILCHDIHAGTIQAIPKILDDLTREGYQFMTVSELIKQQSTE